MFGQRKHILELEVSCPYRFDRERHAPCDQLELRVALSNARHLPAFPERQEHDRYPRLLGRRPKPVCGAIVEPFFIGTKKGEPYSEHAGLLLPVWEQLRRF